MNSPLPSQIEALDREIDLILNAVRQTQPACDFQDRLLSALEQHPGAATYRFLSNGAQRSQETPRFRLWRPLGFSAAALAATLAWFLLPQAGTQKGPPPPPSPAVVKATVPNPVFFGNSTSRHPPATRLATNAPRFPSRTHSTATLGTSTRPPSKLEQQAVADLHAPSQPAPPLPPTSQERLVRLMLRSGEEVQLAKLDLARDPELQRAEIAAFRNFFEPPSTSQEAPAPSPEKPSQKQPEASPKP